MEHRRPKAGDAPHEGLLKVERRGFRVQGSGFRFRSLGFGSLGFGSLGLGSLGLGSLGFGSLGLGSLGFGSLGFGGLRPQLEKNGPSRNWPK